MARSESKPQTCGLIMPISPIDGCSAEHWSEVRDIITEVVASITDPTFTVNLVSDADDVGVIQKRIVQNVYNSSIVICDVSAKNPNVMFELGMRLAFDKPTIIIKDDCTDYTFDTGIIEHLQYPRDLRFNKIVTFKQALSEKIIGTHRAATNEPNYSTFLKNFGKFQVANLEEDPTSTDAVILGEIAELRLEFSRFRQSTFTSAKQSDEVSSSDESRKQQRTGYVKMLDAVYAYAQKEHIEIKDIDQRRLENYLLVQRVGWPKFFPNYNDFKRTLDTVLGELNAARL